jgi:hypothetical protein
LNTTSTPPRPKPPPDPDPDTLAGRVFAALYALPPQFQSDLDISGVRATDLFTFNASLGATIEEQVVDALNSLRSSTWDQDEQHAQYRFVRQPQTFPDVILRAAAPGVTPEILLGVELKGWYVLAKEREPSFRYRVTPAVCAPHDFLVVFPWALSRVISGSPELFTPYVVNARYAAEYRNWHWKHMVRGGAPEGEIRVSEVAHHYPSKVEEISDEAVNDRGGNFGRFARTGLMDDFVEELFHDDLAGIPLDAWQRFLKLFGEQTPVERIYRELDRMANDVARRRRAPASDTVDALKGRLREVRCAQTSVLGRTVGAGWLA